MLPIGCKQRRYFFPGTGPSVISETEKSVRPRIKERSEDSKNLVLTDLLIKKRTLVARLPLMA